jgi:L-alanine-DL-glutamate epimerase-like enolase superfamily enzyme
VKVTDVRIRVVSVPFTEAETWRYGRLWGLTSAIVEVETDQGLTGIGETNGSPLIGLVVEALRANVRWLLGEDPRHINTFLRRSRARGWHHYPHIGNMALAALEMSLWDIVGKAHNAPVHQFFGGLERTSVPYFWYVTAYDRTPETVRRQAAEGVRRGFKTMYLKIGFDVDDDVALTRAMREEVGPNIGIRVDVNEGWSRYEAVRALRAFEELDIEFVEEPLNMHDRAGLAFLRRQTATRLGSNQSSWLPHDVLDVIERGAADVVVTDPHQLGGLSVFRDVAAMCELAGVPLIKHAFGDLGITTAATLHVLATLPEPALANQQFISILESDLLTTPLEFKGGKLEVPMGPGLGVELDGDAVEHYAGLYQKYGEFEGYSPGFRESPIPANELRSGRGSRGAIPSKRL